LTYPLNDTPTQGIYSQEKGQKFILRRITTQNYQ